MKVRFKMFSACARVPQKSTISAACYNLFAATCVVLESGATRSVKIDNDFCFSEKYVAKIYPRSSVSLKSVFLGGGIIDSDYRGNVRVILNNLSQNRLEFKTGDRIAQALFQKKKSHQNSLKLLILTISPTRETPRGLDQKVSENGN